jgi:assimilatory nitrate reductase catalytic subunit
MNAPAQHPPAIRTTCPYCGVGCGIIAKPDMQGGAIIAGDPRHPANLGRLCSKGTALGETLGLENRLLRPMLREADGNLAPVTWESALDRVANGFAQTIAQHGPDAIAFYLSGQLLTEDYYVANKLMKGFIGSPNVDTNSRLCMASSVAGHRRAFGADTVPGVYEDLDIADLIILVGSNAAWCHPVLYQRIVANKHSRGSRIVVIDPRRTATAEDADLFLPIAPGMDSVLFAGLLVYLAETTALDYSSIDAHTLGFTNALVRAREIAPDIEVTAARAGLSASDVSRFFQWFAATSNVVTCFSQGVNQSAQGTDKVTSIINCHLATGRIGKPGMGPFSLTGQPNAMGGREVGGLANQLAAHMAFSPAEIDCVARFWNAPRIVRREGLKAVQMFDAIERGKIKALWVMGTNPAVSLPRARAVRDSLSKLDLFVISDNVISNDTIDAGAQILLPACAWGEKDGTVTNSERRISRQRPFLKAPGEVKSDWWIVTQVARRMGFGEDFAYRTVADVFREHAALSAFENAGTRDFDIGALSQLDDDEFNALDPVQWPAREGMAGTTTRFFGDGQFFTADRKARFIACAKPALSADVSQHFPLRLNTGRVRDQWHTMTRSGQSPRLANHSPEPFVEIHPADAANAGLTDGAFARVSSSYGTCVLKVVVTDSQKRGSLFAPIHWNDKTASEARVGDLVMPANDPYSGQPEAKATPVSVEPVSFAYRGFLLARALPMMPPGAWWARVAVANGQGLLFASNEPPGTWRKRAAALLGARETAEFFDEPRGIYRVAAFADGRFMGCLFLGKAGTIPQWDSIKTIFEGEALSEPERRAMLSGKSTKGIADPGPLVCACFGVGLNVIRAALASGRAASVEQIGVALRAGTNCGSCLPELKRIVGDDRVAQTA